MRHHHSKGGGRRTSRDRTFDRLEKAPRFLIVCEGERTEPNYFEAFHAPGEVWPVSVVGEGYNTVRLVQRAIELADTAQPPYDQIWCVFDRDSFPVEHFNAAIQLAERQGFHVAYSNEAFELWYLLHFDYYDTGISRRSYCERLSDKLKRKYQKNDENIYADLRTRQLDAIRNAKRLLSQYDPRRPVHDNPSTTVFELVEALNKYLVENRMKALERRHED